MIKRLFLNDRFILLLIILNAVIIFFNGFPIDNLAKNILLVLDNFVTGLFVIEIIVKLNHYGKTYFSSNWNKMDFALVALSLPAFISFTFQLDITDFSFLLVLRVLRVFKSFRFIKFVPGINQLLSGIQRAMKASIIVLLGFFIYIFIIGLFSYYLFKDASPEYFKDPLTSLYSIFKIFTIEGWYSIPESVTMNFSKTASLFTHLYFIFVLLTGGIFGLSLVNSIFVDAMVSDNTDELEKKVDLLNEKMNQLLNNKNDGISE